MGYMVVENVNSTLLQQKGLPPHPYHDARSMGAMVAFNAPN